MLATQTCQLPLSTAPSQNSKKITIHACTFLLAFLLEIRLTLITETETPIRGIERKGGGGGGRADSKLLGGGGERGGCIFEKLMVNEPYPHM